MPNFKLPSNCPNYITLNYPNFPWTFYFLPLFISCSAASPTTLWSSSSSSSTSSSLMSSTESRFSWVLVLQLQKKISWWALFLQFFQKYNRVIQGNFWITLRKIRITLPCPKMWTALFWLILAKKKPKNWRAPLSLCLCHNTKASYLCLLFSGCCPKVMI